MDRLPKLVLTGQSTATTYHFRCEPQGFGWALATVNDQTGELLVMSDWGHWSYRWHASPENLGAPTLTHFLGKLPHVESDYLARKLTTREERQRFDRAKTIAAFRKRICEERLEVARRLQKPRLTREVARELWDDLGELDEDNSTLFVDRLMNLRHVQLLDEEPWDSLEYVPDPSYTVLKEAILPALIDACAAEVKRRIEAEAKYVVPAPEAPHV